MHKQRKERVCLAQAMRATSVLASPDLHGSEDQPPMISLQDSCEENITLFFGNCGKLIDQRILMNFPYDSIDK